MPHAGILDLDQHVFAGGHARPRKLQALALADVARADGQAAAVGHGVPGVDRQVDDHLLELRAVGLDVPEVAARQDLELDRLAERTVEQRCQVGEHLAQLQHLGLQRLPAREGQQLTHQAGGAVGAALDVHDVAVGGIGRAVRLQQQVGEADDGGQHVVEVVRHAAGELCRPPPSCGSARTSAPAPSARWRRWRRGWRPRVRAGPRQRADIDAPRQLALRTPNETSMGAAPVRPETARSQRLGELAGRASSSPSGTQARRPSSARRGPRPRTCA